MHPEEDAPTPPLKTMTQQRFGWTSPDVCSLCATGFQFEGRFPGPKALKEITEFPSAGRGSA